MGELIALGVHNNARNGHAGTLMRYLAALPLLLGLSSTAFANTFRLERVDNYDRRTRLALIEINPYETEMKIFLECHQAWKFAVDVSIDGAAISYLADGFNDPA